MLEDYSSVKSFSTDFFENRKLSFGRLFLNEDDNTVTLRNKFLSKITGRMIIKSVILKTMEAKLYSDSIITLVCKTRDNFTIKIELNFDGCYDKNKILAIYYTSKFIESYYDKGATLRKQPEVYQIRFTDYKIFDDGKITHHFLYSDEMDKELNNVIRISFIQIPKVKRMVCKLLEIKNRMEPSVEQRCSRPLD